MDYYLKAPDEATLWSVLTSAGAVIETQVKNAEGEVVETRYVANTGFDLDVIGTISKPTGNKIQITVDDGRVYEAPEMQTLDGFHANLRGPDTLMSKIEYVLPTANSDVAPSELAVVATTITSQLESILVYPKTPVRVWF